MPEMNGITMMKNLRADSWGKTVPIIIMTNVDPDDRILKEIILDKPSYYILKSNTKLSDIVEKIRELLPNKTRN